MIVSSPASPYRSRMHARLPTPPPSWPFLACGLAVLAVLVWFGSLEISVLQAWLGLLAALLSLAAMYRAHRDLEQRSAAATAAAVDYRQQLDDTRKAQEKLAADLGQLRHFNNRLLGDSNLEEALLTSSQSLSMLLPGCAGSIYPLTEGEGLALESDLWGIHACRTQAQAGAEDCWSLHRKRLHIGHSHSPESLCAHVEPLEGATFVTACIPLLTPNETHGWLYLSAPSEAELNLPIALMAAEYLAVTLANQKLRANLRDQSVRDPLTGLFNRRYLTESLGREMARSGRRNLPLAVMAFDIDHFKRFNDTYGHAAGDAVLVAFSRLLQSSSRSEDIACRMGGEEFVLIMPEMELAVAQRRAEELIAAVPRMTVMHDGQRLPPVTTSIGIAVFPLHGRKPEDVLSRADQALYRAKGAGRNRLVVAVPPEAAPAT